jgi:hypothetical protein
MLDVLKDVQEMLTLMKKHDSQDLAGSEREHTQATSLFTTANRAHLFCRE